MNHTYSSHTILIQMDSTVLHENSNVNYDFLQNAFGVRSLRDNNDEMMAALYLQVSIVSQALIFVTRSRSWCFVERPGLLLVSAFIIAQLVSSSSPLFFLCKFHAHHLPTYCHSLVNNLSAYIFTWIHDGIFLGMFVLVSESFSQISIWRRMFVLVNCKASSLSLLSGCNPHSCLCRLGFC